MASLMPCISRRCSSLSDEFTAATIFCVVSFDLPVLKRRRSASSRSLMDVFFSLTRSTQRCSGGRSRLTMNFSNCLRGCGGVFPNCSECWIAADTVKVKQARARKRIVFIAKLQGDGGGECSRQYRDQANSSRHARRAQHCTNNKVGANPGKTFYSKLLSTTSSLHVHGRYNRWYAN